MGLRDLSSLRRYHLSPRALGCGSQVWLELCPNQAPLPLACLPMAFKLHEAGKYSSCPNPSSWAVLGRGPRPLSAI